jgi:NTP pyrophosphatase (non-canonical NTP hydrolase)
VAEKIKKIVRDRDNVVDDKCRAELEKELGDVLWYIANLAVELDLDLENIAQKNIKKLADRQERGVLHGSGDNR